MGGGLWKIIGGVGTLLSIIAYATGITRDVIEIFKDDKPAIETNLTSDPKSESSGKKAKDNKTVTYGSVAQKPTNAGGGNNRFLRIEHNDHLRVYICTNGDRYETDWENETYNGHGTLHFNVGDGKKNEYIGEFKDFNPDGYGTMYYSNSSSLTGNWKAGKYISK